MSASPAFNPSLFSNARGVNTHGGQHNAAGHDIIHNHFYNSPGHISGSSHENNVNAASDQPGASALSSGSLFRLFGFLRTRPLDIDVIDIIEAEYSSLLNRPSAPKDSEMYVRLMLKHRHGFPLYHPEPKRSLPMEYRQKGIRIGDVGRITPDGAFDFLFNVDSSQANLVNRAPLPRDFETVPPVRVLSEDYFQSGENLLGGQVQQTQDIPITYKFSTSDGSVLQLPEGATLFEAESTNDLYDLATRHAQSWYEYLATYRSRDIPNGSLYLVTGCVKTKNWGTGALYACPSGSDYLAFISEDQSLGQKYGWRKRGPITTKVGPTSTDIIVTGSDEPNQCVFIRGYKIALGEKLWKEVRRKTISVTSKKGGLFNPTSSPFTSAHRGGLGHQSNSFSRSVTPKGPTSGHVTHSGIIEDSAHHEEFDQDLDDLSISDGLGEESESVVVEPIFSLEPPAHPSDIIISTLAHLEPEADVALVHDSEWCHLLPENFAIDYPNLNIRGLLENIAKSCLVAVDQNGCVSLVNAPTVDSAKSPSDNIPEPGYASEISPDTEDTEVTQNQCDVGYLTNESEGKIDTEASKVKGASECRRGECSGTAPTEPSHSNAITTPARTFPTEMIEEILNHLDFLSMMRCRAVSSAFRELIDSSPYFHWKRKLAISGMEDGGRYPLSTRRQMLEQHQQGWTNLQWTREQRKKYMLGAYSTGEGVFVQRNPNNTVMYFDKMGSPSRNIEPRCWTVDIGQLSLDFFKTDPAQDLLIIFKQPFREQSQYICQFLLWTLSAGDPHPLAEGTHILSYASTCPQPLPGPSRAKICGENLCVLFDDGIETEIKVWNWKTGQVVASIVSDHVGALTFLSERHIMFTINQEPRLCVIDFISEPPEKQRLSHVKEAYTFGFPPLAETTELISIILSNSSQSNSLPAFEAPFFTARNPKLCVIYLVVADPWGDAKEVQIISHSTMFLSLVESAARLNTTHFDWPAWGPDGARMMLTDSPDIYFYDHGMMLVSTQQPAGQPANYVNIYDFNQLAVKCNKNDGDSTAELKVDADIGCSTHGGKAKESERYVHIMEPTKMVAGDIFRDEVETRLGYRMNRWSIPGQPRVRAVQCFEDGIILEYGQSRIEEFHFLML